MGFNTLNRAGVAETQADIVAAKTQAKPELYTEEVKFPGLQLIHTMTEGELIAFFTTILKSRMFIRELDLTLGDKYTAQERQVTVPQSDKLHELDFERVAKVITMALAGGGETCIGVKIVIEAGENNVIRSKIFVKNADKPIHGPTYDESGNVATQGDPEFAPKLLLTYKP